MIMKKNTAIARFAIFIFTVMCSLPVMAQDENIGFHQALKTKFIEGNAGFMSLVAIALIVGLAFCIERIIYLSLSEINAKKLMQDIDQKVEAGDVEGAKELCRNTRGPVASICYQGLMHIDEHLDDIERSVSGYGTVQAANLEKGCSWIEALHRHGSFPRIPGYGDRYGDGFRPDSAGGRYQSYHRGFGYEGGADYYHLRYHCSLDSDGVL